MELLGPGLGLGMMMVECCLVRFSLGEFLIMYDSFESVFSALDKIELHYILLKDAQIGKQIVPSSF